MRLFEGMIQLKKKLKYSVMFSNPSLLWPGYPTPGRQGVFCSLLRKEGGYPPFFWARSARKKVFGSEGEALDFFWEILKKLLTKNAIKSDLKKTGSKCFLKNGSRESLKNAKKIRTHPILTQIFSPRGGGGVQPPFFGSRGGRGEVTRLLQRANGSSDTLIVTEIFGPSGRGSDPFFGSRGGGVLSNGM